MPEFIRLLMGKVDDAVESAERQHGLRPQESEDIELIHPASRQNHRQDVLHRGSFLRMDIPKSNA